MDRVWKNLISEENIVKWRRYFHKYPELSFHEKKLHNLYMIHYAHFLFEVTRPTKYSVLAIKRGTEQGK